MVKQVRKKYSLIVSAGKASIAQPKSVVKKASPVYNLAFMVKFLRNKTVQKQVYLILAIVIIPAFLFWGISLSEKMGTQATVLAVFEGKKITPADYFKSYKAIQHEIQLKYGEEAVSQIVPMIDIKGEAWDRILLLEYARKNRIKTSDGEVVAWLASQPVFSSGKGGSFNKELYRVYTEKYFRMKTRDFEEEIRQILTMDKIRQSLRSKVKLTDAELRSLYNQENGDRGLAYAILPWESQKDKITLSDAELEKLYPLFKDQLLPAEGTPIGEKKETKVPSFEESKETLRTLLTKQKAIEQAIQNLNDLKLKMTGSVSFENALAGEGIEVKTLEKFHKGVEVPGIGRSMILETLLPSLKEGEISEAFAIPSGAAILKVTKDFSADDKKFEEEKDAFKERMINKKATEEMKTLLEGLRQKMKFDPEAMKEFFPDTPEE
jgi:hypothetical protein